MKKLAALWTYRRGGLERFNTKIHLYQQKIADFVKKHRTVKFIHLVRNYSALAVVISGSFLVAGTNIHAEQESDGFLFGYLEKTVSSTAQKQTSLLSARKENLTYAPVMKARSIVDPQIEEEEMKNMPNLREQAFIAAGGSPMRDPAEDGGVKIYEVKEGDTVSGIAARHGISVNTVLWANDIDNIDSIMPGDKIFILPVAGVSHTVRSGETLDGIAKKYKADKEKIIAFNDLPADGSIAEGETIIVPGGQKETPASIAPTDTFRRQYATPQGGAPAVSGWRKLEGKAGTGHKFPYGYCTWYVAQRRYVPWGGNAGTWLYHAKNAGYQTGKSPRPGSIIVTTESWWGHVGLVEKVGGGTVTISEMNYKKWGKVNKRTISTSSRVIKGYIY